jgi:hypothetical protein
MIRSCPDRLEFKNECYSTVNQSISKKTSIFALTLIFSPYKPELSMIRSCPNRLEFKNECYSTVNQSISKKTSIYALILWRFIRTKYQGEFSLVRRIYTGIFAGNYLLILSKDIIAIFFYFHAIT